MAVIIVATGLGLLAWLVTSDLWQPMRPLPGLLFGGALLVAWLGLAWRFGGERLRSQLQSAAALLCVAGAAELGLALATGGYTSIGLTLVILGGSGGLAFTVAMQVLEDGQR